MIDKIYIKQCENAKEIQTGHLFKYGDWYVVREDTLAFTSRSEELIGKYLLPEIYSDTTFMKNRYMLWLPTQAQLQEMLDTIFYSPKDINGIVNMVVGFDLWVRQNWMPFTSMESLWLAFVMKELYEKTWNGEDWVETNKVPSV